jgi:CheY-like chemotaxis protein/c-di-GMP-binding flagellar brake protein YcgR
MSKLPRRILVADSDYAFAQSLRADLEARGYGVEVVSDGLSAINMVKTRPFSGAVVDTDLIAVDGLQVLSIIKDLKRALPVVVTSKREPAATERAAREAGAEAYEPKPCPPARVAEALEQCMSGSASIPRKRPSLTLGRLEAGQVLLLQCPGGHITGRLTSRLVAKHPASLAVAAPRREGELVSLPFGAAVTVGFPMPDGWYHFDTHVLGAVSYRGEPAILLAQPRLVSHIQRRRYVRIRGAFSVMLGGERCPPTGKGQDVGEGGMRVLTEEPLAVGSRVACRIQAEGAQDQITISGTVVWAEELRDDGHRCRAGVEFPTASGAERKRLRTWAEALARQRGGPPGPERAGDGPGACAVS